MNARDPRLPLPAELSDACESVGLRVLTCSLETGGAILTERLFGNHRLLVSDTWAYERQLCTVRQSLAELGAAGFEAVPVEPFGCPSGEIAHA